ncbi:MAG TPA: hypothetical protein VFX28_18045 [Methylomirabilota bacterium]|nr:hypothetical protein [Methylomirabilota bacterium]
MPELTRRYVVMALATPAAFDPADTDAPFVLKPWKDPAALHALRAYRDHCYPELRRDLEAWIRVIEAGPRVRGDVGRRNEPHAGGGGAPARRARGRTAPPAGRSGHARRGTGGRGARAHRKKRRR